MLCRPERQPSSFLGPELSDAKRRRESRQTLTGSTALRHDNVEDYSEFLICSVGQLGQRLWVCKETQRWRGRPLAGKSFGGELWSFVARASGGGTSSALPNATRWGLHQAHIAISP